MFPRCKPVFHTHRRPFLLPPVIGLQALHVTAFAIKSSFFRYPPPPTVPVCASVSLFPEWCFSFHVTPFHCNYITQAMQTSQRGLCSEAKCLVLEVQRLTSRWGGRDLSVFSQQEVSCCGWAAGDFSHMVVCKCQVVRRLYL